MLYILYVLNHLCCQNRLKLTSNIILLLTLLSSNFS